MYLCLFTAGGSCICHTCYSSHLLHILTASYAVSSVCVCIIHIRGFSVDTLLLVQQHKHRLYEAGCVWGMFELRVCLCWSSDFICFLYTPELTEYSPYVSFFPPDCLLFETANYCVTMMFATKEMCTGGGDWKGQKAKMCMYEVGHHNFLLMYQNN